MITGDPSGPRSGPINEFQYSGSRTSTNLVAFPFKYALGMSAWIISRLCMQANEAIKRMDVNHATGEKVDSKLTPGSMVYPWTTRRDLYLTISP